MPSVADAASRARNVFPWLMEQVLPGAVGKLLWLGIVIANYLCGLACVTSTSRMMYAFARDGGLPCSYAAAQVSPALADAGRRRSGSPPRSRSPPRCMRPPTPRSPRPASSSSTCRT